MHRAGIPAPSLALDTTITIAIAITIYSGFYFLNLLDRVKPDHYPLLSQCITSILKRYASHHSDLHAHWSTFVRRPDTTCSSVNAPLRCVCVVTDANSM